MGTICGKKTKKKEEGRKVSPEPEQNEKGEA
jgi:hypothetical protein